MKHLLYRFFAWFCLFDLAIANATGRDPECIKDIRNKKAYWEGLRDSEGIQL